MVVTKISILSGIKSDRELDITMTQLIRIAKGEHVQNVVPHLSPEEREFLISGMTEEEQQEIFGTHENEY